MNTQQILSAQQLPIPASEIAALLGQRLEFVYADLVRLEGEGRARPILGYVRGIDSTGKRPTVAGWIATPEAARQER